MDSLFDNFPVYFTFIIYNDIIHNFIMKVGEPCQVRLKIFLNLDFKVQHYYVYYA